MAPPRRATLFAVLFSVALAVYAPRACRTLSVAGDSAELVAAAAVWGVPHPPGYPLYTLVAHVFTLLPWFELPFRVHLASALFHAAAVGFVGCAIDVWTGSLVAAAIASCALALGRVFLVGSLYAEVFPLNDLFFAASLFLGALARDRDRVSWWPLALVAGLGHAHHPAFVLGLPAIGLIVARPLARDVRARRRLAFEIAGVIALAVFVSYALVPLAAMRRPPVSWGDARDVGSLLRLVTRQDYGGPLRASRGLVEGQLLERVDLWFAATASSFRIVATLLAALGLVAAWRRDRLLALGLALGVALSGPVLAAANAIDIHSTYRAAFFERFFTMSHLALAALTGLGAAAAIQKRPSTPAIPVALLALAGLDLAPSFFAIDLSSDRLGIDYARDLVLSTPDRSLLLLKGDMPSQAAQYVCAVETKCGRRIVVAPGQLFMPWKRRELAARYPELSLPDNDAARTLALAELERRPVFVHPELLDDALSAAQAALPAGLLFRVYATEEAARTDRATVRNAAPETPVSPCPLDDQLVRAYESAARAHAAAARELGVP